MAHAVFSVSELLEMTLLRLPLKDLQCSRAVCKSWKEAVDSSIKIKRALYLEAGTADDHAIDNPWNTDMENVPAAAQEACGGSFNDHPCLVDSEQAGQLSECYLKHAEGSLRNAYIMQPPMMSSFTSIIVYHHQRCYPDRYILKAGETFGSLSTRIQESRRPSVRKVIYIWTNAEDENDL
ncbi:hypothetical protein LTR56_024231 [Elasticomyces elasticus]|nr:hypothetical protein LTR56_024231 [Elasticomyces elasticus]KAK4905984.1 hypothetical protein LTR49_024797 [Elasticomyces elasticus]